MMSGGAPLSPATHEYLRAVLGVDLLQVIVVIVIVVVMERALVWRERPSAASLPHVACRIEFNFN